MSEKMDDSYEQLPA
jgi:hypothetical protein